MEKVPAPPKTLQEVQPPQEMLPKVVKKTTLSPLPVDQLALTVIAPIEPSKVDYLRSLLKSIRDQDIETNPILPFKEIKGIHFCRFLVLEQDGKFPAQLVYASNFDDSEDAHFNAITDAPFLSGYQQIFSCCVGYDANAESKKAVIGFIKRNRKQVHTFYRGHRGLSLEQIRKEDLIYKSIQEFLNKPRSTELKKDQIKQEIEEHLKLLPFSIAAPKINWPHWSIIKVGAVYLVIPLVAILLASWLMNILLIVSLTLITVLAVAALYLRHLENNASELKQEGEVIKESQQNASELIVFEDRQVQNQLSHLVELRPGIFRRSLQTFALAALSKLAILTYNQGRLGDIATIHFARWSLIDNGKRLMFFSNFDGSWENYLGDFVDRAAIGLTLAWSNTKEFPKTRWLFMDGATNEELFKTWTRKNQVKTQVWYTAYKHLTVKNILRNHEIVLGIGNEMTEQELDNWLKLL